MALLASDLRDELDARASQVIGSDYDALSAELKAKLWTVIAESVTVWLTGGTGASGVLPGADVSTTVSVTSVSGVTPGSGASGPGSGSGSGSIA